MKKVVSTLLIAGFIASTMSVSAFAAPAKKKTVQAETKTVVTKMVTKQVLEVAKPTNKTEQKVTTTSAIKVEKAKSTSVTKDKKKAMPAKAKKKTVPPVIKIGKMVIPTTPLIKDLKADVQWDSATKTLIVSKDGTVIKIVGDSKIYVNDKLVDAKTRAKATGSIIPFIKKTLRTNNTQTPTTPPTDGQTPPVDNTQPTPPVDNTQPTPPPVDNTQPTTPPVDNTQPTN